MSARILVVDDDPGIQDVVRFALAGGASTSKRSATGSRPSSVPQPTSTTSSSST